MNKFSLWKTVLFCAITIHFLFTACKKDIAGHFAGEYTGIVNTYSFATGASQTFSDTRISITKLSKTTIRLDVVSSSSLHNFSGEETLRKNGTFGDGQYTPSGTFLQLGQEGKFFGDSLLYSMNTFDSLGNIAFFFRGRRN
jgi:hypothetical protein